MSARMALHVALSLRLDAIEAHRLAKDYRAEVLHETPLFLAEFDSVSVEVHLTLDSARAACDDIAKTVANGQSWDWARDEDGRHLQFWTHKDDDRPLHLTGGTVDEVRVKRAESAHAEEKTTLSTMGPAVTPEPSRGRIERYTSALRDADPYALVERRDDLARFANAAMVAADNELDQVYRDAYGTGREHAGAPGWLLNNFEAVTSTSGGSYGVAEEYRCRTCGAIGAQGTDDRRTLLDLVSMASRHKCLPSLPDGAS